MRKILLSIIIILMSQFAWSQIDSAYYDASSGLFTIYGSGFNGGNDVFHELITIKGLNSTSYTLTSATATVTPENGSRIELTIGGIDRAFMNALIDQDGETDSNTDYYLFDVADSWHNGLSAEINDTITVSNYAPPSITSATYDASTGILVVTGDRLAANASVDDDINVSHLYVTGEGGTTVQLTSTSDVEVTSHDEFTITLVAADKSNVDNVLDENGTQASDNTTDYDITGTEDWNDASNGTDVEVGPNQITVSNVPIVLNFTANKDEICEGDSVEMSVAPTGGNGSFTYAWNSLPPGFTSTDPNVKVFPTENTTYTVVVSSDGYDNSADTTIVVNGLPSLTSSVVTDPICSGADFVYVPTSDKNVTDFDWTRPNTSGIVEGANSGTGNILETLTNDSVDQAPVTYKYVMTTDKGCVDSANFVVRVNPLGTVDPITDVLQCEGTTVSEISFSSSNQNGTNSFDWVADNTSIGISGSSGTGNISSFTAATSGTEPEFANISVTPKYERDGKTCTGTAESFEIVINPSGQVNTISDQTVCDGSNTLYVNFETVNTNGTTIFDWTNDETDIGLVGSGSGDIPSFEGANASNDVLTGLIEVTPIFTYDGESCSGSPETFNINVNPNGQVDVISDQTICVGNNTALIEFTTSNNGGLTVYNWSNDNTTIGLIGASGIGDISSFTTTNVTTQPQTANIVVEPEYTSGGKTCVGSSESFQIIVNPLGQVDPLADQVVCEGEQTAYVNFVTNNTLGTTVFDWTNTNTSIGLAGSGNNDIPAFTAANGGTSPITGTIEVTPEFTYNSQSCSGTPESFTITSNPAAQVNTITDIVVCNGSATGDIIFATNNTGGTTDYSWTNSNTAIGLGASGSGDILSFTATNSGNSPIIATIIVTPTFDNGSEICDGTSETFTITVNPTAQVNAVSDITICSEQRIADIDFATSNVLGTTIFDWSNDQPSIGLPGAGLGDILSFVASNVTQSQVIANVIVNPTYTYDGETCPGSPESFQITVNPIPIVDFTMPQTTYGDDAPADTIKGAIPYGGTFFGPGIIAQDSTFHPTSAGLGDHIISYAGFNGFGCRDTATASVSVLPPGGSITGLEAFYCDYAPKDTIRGRPDTGGTLDSLGCGFTPSAGLIIVNDSIAVIDPALMSGTNVQIKFTYYKGAYFDVINTTTIHEVQGTADFIGLPNPGICVNENAVTLAGSPSGGTFFGPGISGDEFDPLEAGINIHDISYTYTLGATGCRDTAVQTTEVFGLTPTTFDADSLYCSNIDPVELIGVPPTGFFTGPNLSGTDTVLFSPNSSIVGPNTITYTYTNANGCVSTHSEEVRVTQVATVGIEAISPNYCENADSVQLRGEVLGFFEGIGDFSGIGVNNNAPDDGIGYFRPDLAGPGGPYEVTFTYTDANSCVSTFSRNIVVRELPNVSINNLDDLYCVNSPTVTIVGVPEGATGSFDYTGNSEDLNDQGGSAFFTPGTITEGDTITYYYTDVYGCTNSFSQELEVVDLPDVFFDSDTQFCPNGSSVEIIGEPPGGFFTGPNITGTDTVIFSPSVSIIGTHDMIYTYTDSNSCTNTFKREFEIQELPTVGIVGLLSSYCVNGDSALLTATANGLPSPEGTFTGQGIFDEIAGDGEAYFIPSDAGVGGPYDITYTFTSLNNCVAIEEESVLVRDLPTVSISSPTDIFCEAGSMTIITGIPQSADGSFGYNGVAANLIDLDNGTAEFYPNNVIDTGIITYTYEDQYGCINFFNDTLKVSALPDVAFAMSSTCMGDTIQFTNETVSAEEILSWAWDFGDPASGNNTSNDENPEHFYATGGDRIITLTANTIDGCSDDVIEDVELGDAPEVDFSWENECFGVSPTVFINNSDDTTAVFWDFGDGINSSEVNPSHMFGSAITYDVTMEVTNQFGCSSEITKSVSIRPFISQFPYLTDFEVIDQSWTVDVNSENNSWEIGSPEGTIISSAFSGSNCWVTGLVNSYQNEESSAVLSPCFDFTDRDKPMIKMQIWNSTQENRDGVVLQAKVDGQTDWFNIGDLNDVINWYNGVGLQGNPGGTQNVGSYGWTGVDNQWSEARHELDELKGKTNVRFRIAFGSDESGTSDGFAFDDVWIGERTKRVLAESFTNAGDNASATINPEFNGLMTANASDIIDIQYHTSFPGADPFNTDNPADVAARTTYYGLSEVPWTILDGNVYSGSTEDVLDNYVLVEEQSLQDPVFSIDLLTTTGGGDINVEVDITANENLSGKNLTLHTVMIESEVTSVTGENGETEFLSVLREMLPNAGGTGLNSTWTNGQTSSYSFSWDYATAIDPEKVNVVAFIQDEDTRKIYQVETDDTATSQTWIPEVVVSFGNDMFMIYPNPSRGDINILFKQETVRSGFINIYNMTGSLVAAERLQIGVNNVQMDLEYLQQGIYLIQVRDENGSLGTKRFIKR